LDIALIGIPFDGGTTYRPGARFGPRNIRVQSAMIRPWNPVLKINPFDKWRVADFGDLSINPLSIEDTYQRITDQLGQVLRSGVRPVCVGGDHSILLPILRAIHRQFGPVGFIQLDAHGDTWSGYFGSPHSHGTPVKYAIEEGLIDKDHALQIGLRGQVYSDADFDFAHKHGIQIVTSEEFHRVGVELAKRHLKKFGARPVYVTLDIDVVDPAFAPGTGTPQVGGLSSAQILELVRVLKGLKLVGCDLVEVSPPYDNGEITSLLAANLLYELLCLF
jgi:agmatinase